MTPRIRLTLAVGTAAALFAAPLAVQARPTAAAAAASTISARHTAMGTILTDGRGFTLYAFSRDGRNRDRCIPTAGCAAIWPAVKTAGRPRAGSGVWGSLLGSIRISGGAMQVTYAGHPVYRYSADSGPAQTGYIGFSSFGGTWKAVRLSGAEVG